MLDGKTILVTGGTGSFGHAFVKALLDKKVNFSKLIILSRDEMKQWNMAQKFDDPRIRFFIGDVRDRERMFRAFEEVDVVIHAAATKIVPTAEYNPFECIKTNIQGAMNIIDAALDKGVSKIIALSTDKASSPVNLYGATKLVSDKIFVASNNYSGTGKSCFSVVRYGNVMGSRGSVIPYFLKLAKEKADFIPITDALMTRFMITLKQGVELVFTALDDMQGGEIYVKKIPSMKILDLANALCPHIPKKIVGIRPGEKLHEEMINSQDAQYTYDYGSHFKIFPNTMEKSRILQMAAHGKRVENGYVYASNTNSEWMTCKDIEEWVNVNISDIIS